MLSFILGLVITVLTVIGIMYPAITNGMILLDLLILGVVFMQFCKDKK